MEENRISGDDGIWSTIDFAKPSNIAVIIIINAKNRKPDGLVKLNGILELRDYYIYT